MDALTHSRLRSIVSLRAFAVWGPGLLVMLADTDAGNVVTAAQAGAVWGYRLMLLPILLIPLLYMVQELAVRLGIHTGRGHGELIRERFGAGWAWLSIGGLAIATLGSLITEFTGVAGIGDLFGISRSITLPLASGALLMVAMTGSYRRVERVALVIGLFELAFFWVAWKTHPDPARLIRETLSPAVGNGTFLYLAAAIVGAVFNPWMVFYQQSAVIDKGLTPSDLCAERLDTAFGAVLTQCLTAAILIAAAGTLGAGGSGASLGSVGAISDSLAPVLGGTMGRLVFAIGVLGAAMVAAIVSSLALAWGVGEVAGFRRSLEMKPQEAGWFYGLYAVSVIGSAALVWLSQDLVWLNITAQVVNAFLLPPVIGFLIILAMRVLPSGIRLAGWPLVVMVLLSVAVSALGLFGGLLGLIQG